MGLNDIDVQKSAILFFDILNGYYHAAKPSAKARMRTTDEVVKMIREAKERL